MLFQRLIKQRKPYVVASFPSVKKNSKLEILLMRGVFIGKLSVEESDRKVNQSLPEKDQFIL